jgi:uncharacterized protein (TIGR03663 family)
MERYGESGIGEFDTYQQDAGSVKGIVSIRSWISAGILLLAFCLRFIWLDLKPAHFDEGVNGWFVDQMTRQGFYHYDPTNFHGPFHFYVLFLAQTLFGRSIVVLRMPIVLLSTGCVGMMLAFRRFFDQRICQIAAAAMAVSPAMVFYGRYAIHETWMLFFLLLTSWGAIGLWRHGRRQYLWTAALGATGLILTKETYVIHFVAFLLAVPCLLLYEKLVPSGEWPYSGPKFSAGDLVSVAIVCFGLILFFYTGGFLDWSALPGLWETFNTWVRTGVEHKSGHEKAWYYWLQLIGQYEWPAAVGIVGGLWMLFPRVPRPLRYLAIYGLGAFIAYSIVPYKTPWCIISLIWPFYFVFGFVVLRAAQLIDTWTIGVAAALVWLGSFGISWKLNFHDYTDETQPYVYVQTLNDINKLLDPLRKLTALNPVNHYLRGHIILEEEYPFTWLLNDFPRVDYPSVDELPETIDADFLLVDDSHVDKIEPLLRLEYYKTPLRVRGSSENSATLYLCRQTFAGLVPDSYPIFKPGNVSTPKEGTPKESPPKESASKEAASKATDSP